METPKEPSAIEMRANLAQDAQSNRYSKEVLIAIMKCIDEENPPIQSEA